jgi:hypothetical protein
VIWAEHKQMIASSAMRRGIKTPKGTVLILLIGSKVAGLQRRRRTSTVVIEEANGRRWY